MTQIKKKALLKVGTDISMKNKHNKIAFDYMEKNEQFRTIYDAHAPSIWTSIDNSKISDIYRLVNSNK